MSDRLARGARELGVALDPAQVEVLERYLDLLERWNRAYNLTAVRDRRQMVTRHLLDSLSIVPRVRGGRVLDVGSGAGLPGLVLAVALPAVEVTLLDPSLKRTRFLDHTVRELRLSRVTVLRGRLEALPPVPGYDTVVSRATLSLEQLRTAARPVIVPGGRLVAMLGRAPQEALSDQPGTVQVLPLSVPGLDAVRHAAVVDYP